MLITLLISNSIISNANSNSNSHSDCNYNNCSNTDIMIKFNGNTNSNTLTLSNSNYMLLYLLQQLTCLTNISIILITLLTITGPNDHHKLQGDLSRF